MANKGLISLLFTAFLLINCNAAANANERKVRIVYMGEPPKGEASAATIHHSILKAVLGSDSSAKESLIYSYRSFSGFAAKLTDEEVEKFSGIWPEHESFNDVGLGAPPSKWKGTCQGTNFTCSNENFYDVTDFKSPRDSEGHGTHTSSTAAGDRVAGASYYGLANGTARGGVPGSRIAMYKVCWSIGCGTADILAAFDDAISDGVDIISVSLGADWPIPYDEDPIAIGSFHAMKNGILTSSSAGGSQDISKYCITGFLNSNPTATILLGETWTDYMAPYVVSFSSRGPNPISPDILKPDLTAPGVDILAAWSPVAIPSIAYEDPRSVNYNIISGTSMSCPHASGAAAYVKAAHPDWSPAAIKSALMTTATVVDPKKHVDLEFAYGSGQINPTEAIKPGLVYDANETDYINFLCKQGYNTTTLRHITGDNSSVCTSTMPGPAWDLNYPSFSLAIVDGQPINGVFPRTVTNVGSPNATYNVWVSTQPGFTISVEPQTLSFSNVGDKKSFTVNVTGPKIAQQEITSGAIIWTDSDHKYVVRSPVVVYNVLPTPFFGFSNSQKKPTFQGPSMYHKNGILGRN
ncbi:hypothetical protein COLO4_23784 [Corchorus olitorius]|uniref:Peptidase S8/S53 domain-containing protein n=1 Tax=Corchorus olitorius TaxID=93759 RepID=A0A1R3IET7_9ROSI|nr:hypothetical protein COLO4_23784 [Corchorus olitorius]